MQNGDASVSLPSALLVCRDRRNLAVALKDTRSVIGTLQTVLGIVIHTFFFFIYFLVLRASVFQPLISDRKILHVFAFLGAIFPFHALLHPSHLHLLRVDGISFVVIRALTFL